MVETGKVWIMAKAQPNRLARFQRDCQKKVTAKAHTDSRKKQSFAAKYNASVSPTGEKRCIASVLEKNTTIWRTIS